MKFILPEELPQLALSVRQPWVHCIFHLGKPVENRTWNTRIRGTVCIHASKGMTQDEYEDCRSFSYQIGQKDDATRELLRQHPVPALRSIPRGFIIGTVDIVDVVRRSNDPWFFGPFGFVLENPRLLEKPIPCIGALGFFDWRQKRSTGVAR
ncbi:ASCH domain-containing protein [Brucella intermedia]|uniref:ASCH domain-containing protein n=1 Tax=Brucella intermedia TaxID=94625 RepID=UPI000E5B160A|nr:ASCH domain-containing protein [Brucella intermedia]MCO7727331.1 ASCH domain-containing protein [Brucella intermedia]